MAPGLVSFLWQLARQPRAGLDSACLMVCAAWIAERSGVDLRPPLRRRGVDMVRAAGGVAALARREMQRSGFAETATPQAGDVGLLAVGRRRVGAICVSAASAAGLPRWAVLTRDRGLVFAARAPATAWSIPCRSR